MSSKARAIVARAAIQVSVPDGQGLPPRLGVPEARPDRRRQSTSAQGLTNGKESSHA